ncbi:MAG: ATP-binding cassette domain-containing protein, partial [Terriglobales bacterium]
MPVLLELRSLGVAIGRTALLHDVSVQLAAGEAMALVGASGSGKTTLLRAIMGLLPPQASLAGQRLWQGRDLFGFSHAEWRLLRGRGIGWIPQEPLAALDPRRTAAQH